MKAFLAALAAAALFLFQPLSPASATVNIGPGYQIPNPYRDSIIGGFNAPNGSVLYCLEWGKESPTNPNDVFDSVEATDQYADWSQLETARVNYIITKWGQTSDNNQAAAVAMAIWLRHPGSDEPFFPEHRFVKATIPDANLRASIVAEARRMNVEADTFMPSVREAVGELIITSSTDDLFTGEVQVSGVSEYAVGTLQLTGAVFETTGTPSIAGVKNGDVLRYRAEGVLNAGSYRVAVHGDFVIPGSPGSELVLWKNSDSFQDLGENSVTVPDFLFVLQAEHEQPLPFHTDTNVLPEPELANTGGAGVAGLGMFGASALVVGGLGRMFSRRCKA